VPGAGPSRLSSGAAVAHPGAGGTSDSSTLPAAASHAEATLRPWAEDAAASGTSGGRSRGDSFSLDTTPTAAAIEAVARLASSGTASNGATSSAADTQPQLGGQQQGAEQAAGSWKQPDGQPAAERNSLESLKPSTRAPDTLGGPDIGLRKTSPPPSPKALQQVCSQRVTRNEREYI
jgi:hypothetical protein